MTIAWIIAGLLVVSVIGAVVVGKCIKWGLGEPNDFDL
jgi:hypothetical protein